MEGIVQSINSYKSGKGAFLRIGGTDYMFFGSPSVKVGDKAIFELGKPSKDGKPTIRAIKPDTIEAYVDEDKIRSLPLYPPTPAIQSKDSRENYWQSKEKRDIENKGIDVMLSCISSACVLFSHSASLQTPDKDILSTAEAFYQAAMKKRVHPHDF